MVRRIYYGLGVMVALACISCDKVPLLAPTNSTVTIDAQSRVLPTGGSTTVTATVIESGGTPVQNGTLVRFSATLGRLDPVEAQTRNGIATTTFFAGDDSGIAEVRATSGGAGGSTTTTPGTGTTPGTPSTTSNSNVVQIAVGAGAVDSVSVRANPSTVSTTRGGTVNVIATVLGVGGRLLSGIPVSFSASRGTLSATSAPTDTQGEARVTLVTNGDTDITVVAGTKTATAKVTGQAGPAVALTCTAGSATNCATASVGQTVVFTAQRQSGSANLVSSSLDFGDNTSGVDLGTLTAPTTVPHAYSQAGTYTARLTGTDANGETSTSTQVIQVNPVTLTVTASVTSGMTVSATATVTAPATQYLWNWGDSTSSTTTTATTTHTYTLANTYTITVTAALQAGGTVQGSTVVVVP
jgi:PKD repeat protein